jgi:hypothetical protein
LTRANYLPLQIKLRGRASTVRHPHYLRGGDYSGPGNETKIRKAVPSAIFVQ